MSATVDVRDAWLAYCRDVVTDTGHVAECAALGGNATGDGFQPDVRWPGYLGRRYAPGGVVWVANIHRNFDSGGMDSSFATRAARAVRAFAAGGDGEAFLNTIAHTYRAGLEQWDVGRWGRKALDKLDVDLDEIVYLNAARCQSVGTGEQLQRLCQRRWPLRSTIAMLRPRLVLLTSLTALTGAGARPWPCIVAAFSQRNGRLVLTSPWKPLSGDLSPSAWMNELADATVGRD